MIYCQKLKKQAEPLSRPPVPGELGQKLLNNISQEAWELWLNHQTMLINEYRLSLLDPEAKKFLRTEMQKFLFEDNAEKPAGYVKPAGSED